MATEVYSKQEIVLQDGTEVTLKPLTIKNLRRFMKAWRHFGDDIETDESLSEEDQAEVARDHEYDVFVECAGIVLENELFDKATKDVEEKDDETKAQLAERKKEVYREYLEDTLDMETIFKAIEVGAGMKLDDPNLLAIAAQNLAEGGTN